jgi:hypothetical protein
MRRDIEFDAEGVTLRGWLYLPDDPHPPAPTVDRCEEVISDVQAVAANALVDRLGPVRNTSTLGESTSAQRQHPRPSPIRRLGALATGVIAALAIAAPVAEASAATPHAAPPPGIASLPAANPQPPSAVEPSVARAAVANGPTLIGDGFNGPTAIVTSPSPAVGTVVGSP